MRDERIMDPQWIRDNTDMYFGTVEIYADDLRELIEAAKDANAKLDYIAKTIKTVDGMFTFPDGDYVETDKL